MPHPCVHWRPRPCASRDGRWPRRLPCRWRRVGGPAARPRGDDVDGVVPGPGRPADRHGAPGRRRCPDRQRARGGADAGDTLVAARRDSASGPAGSSRPSSRSPQVSRVWWPTPAPECGVDITLFGLVPGALLWALVRRAAPLRPAWTGLLAMLTAAAVGAFGTQWSAPTVTARTCCSGTSGR